MNEPAFDPNGFYEFDFEQGMVRVKEGNRVVMVSDHVLATLVSAAVLQGDLTAIRRLGKQLGEQMVRSLQSPTEASPEVVLNHANAVLGLFGWGKLRLERWGQAVVAYLENAPALDDTQLAIAELIGGVFTSLMGREVSSVSIDHEKFMLVDPGIADQIAQWVKDGLNIGQVSERLAQGVAS